MCIRDRYIAQGGIEYAHDMLERALGTQRALDIINRLTASLQVRPFDFARKTDANQLLSFIQNEHPQTIALVTAYLQPDQGAHIPVSYTHLDVYKRQVVKALELGRR